MLKSLYLSAAGMLPKRRELEITANNLANLNTTGFKKDSVFYRHFLENVESSQNVMGEKTSVLNAGDVFTEYSQGTLEKTGNSLDVAIVGDGFFSIQENNQQMYTRNGHFLLDADGKLVDSSGNAVLTDGGEIYINGNDISISETGQIIVDKRKVGQLNIVTFNDLSNLEKMGKTYFKPTNENTEITIEPEHINLKQGYLEGSNVNPMDEMSPKEKLMYYFKNFPIRNGRFMFFIFILIFVQTLFAHNWLTLPQYFSRAFTGVIQDNFEFFVNLNPIFIFVLTPMVTALTSKKDTYKMMIIGTFVMAAPTFFLAMGTNHDQLGVVFFGKTMDFMRR